MFAADADAALLLAGSRHEEVAVSGLLPGHGLAGGGAEPADRPFDASMGDTLLAVADRSADTTLPTDPLVELNLIDLRPADYAAFFAATAQSVLLGENGDDRPPWWLAVRDSECSAPGPNDPSAMVAALARL